MERLFAILFFGLVAATAIVIVQTSADLPPRVPPSLDESRFFALTLGFGVGLVALIVLYVARYRR